MPRLGMLNYNGLSVRAIAELWLVASQTQTSRRCCSPKKIAPAGRITLYWSGDEAYLALAIQTDRGQFLALDPAPV